MGIKEVSEGQESLILIGIYIYIYIRTVKGCVFLLQLPKKLKLREEMQRERGRTRTMRRRIHHYRRRILCCKNKVRRTVA